MADTNQYFRINFDDFCFIKRNFAFSLALEYIESLNLNVLKLKQQVLKLKEEKELHKKKIDDFKRKEYLFFADDDNQLYNIFTAHLLFYKRNEKPIIEECFILNERDKLLSKLLLETIAQLPLFTLTDCLNNKKNVVFYELNQQPFGTSNEEYSKMRNWQSNKKLSPDPYLVKLFDLTFEEGLCQSNKAFAEFEEKYKVQKIKEDKYHSVLLRKQNKIRLGIKMLDYPEYYQHLPNRENVKRIFLNNCILNKDIENQQLELIKAIVLYDKNKFIFHELFMMDQEIICTPIDYDFMVHQLNDILSILIPDSDLTDQWQNALAKASGSTVTRIPILFIIQNLIESFEWISKRAVSKLQKLFYYQPSERIVTYIMEQIKDLIYMESNEPRNGPTLNHIIANLKLDFRSEMEIATFHQNNKLTKLDDLLDEPKIQTKIKLSFKLLKAPELLFPIIQALIARLNFLDNRTTIETFIRIVTSDDLYTINEKIYLGCKTNEFSYLLNYFKIYFKSFNPATIEKSGLFISNDGNPIKASSLYNAVSDNLQIKIAIDTIFSQKNLNRLSSLSI